MLCGGVSWALDGSDCGVEQLLAMPCHGHGCVVTLPGQGNGCACVVVAAWDCWLPAWMDGVGGVVGGQLLVWGAGVLAMWISCRTVLAVIQRFSVRTSALGLGLQRLAAVFTRS